MSESVTESILKPAAPAPTRRSVRRLGETLPPRAKEIERLRRLPDDLVAKLTDTGVFRMFVPGLYGGYQQEPREALAVIEELAYAWEEAKSGELGVEPRRRLRQAATFAMRSAVSAVDAMAELAGGTAVFESSPLEQIFRDVHVAASHGMVARRTYEFCGRLALGLETEISHL